MQNKQEKYRFQARRKDTAGVAGVEPAVTVLETVGLPLTDAPILSLYEARAYGKTYKIYLVLVYPVAFFYF